MNENTTIELADMLEIAVKGLFKSNHNNVEIKVYFLVAHKRQNIEGTNMARQGMGYYRLNRLQFVTTIPRRSLNSENED